MSKVVVTGASGHIGYNVAVVLLERGHEVHLLVRRANMNITALQLKGAKVYSCDLFDPASYNAILENTDAFFHLAAENTTSVKDRARIVKNTFELTRVVLNTAISAHVKTIIYTSSVVVLGRSPDAGKLIDESSVNSAPESPYVEGKLQAENYISKLVNEQDADIRRVYPVWVAGPGDPKLTPPHKVMKDFLEKGMKFYFEGGISLAHVKDIARGHVNAWELGKKNEKYILGGENIRFRDLYKMLSQHSSHRPPSLKLPKWFIKIAAYAGSLAFKLFGKEFPISPSYVEAVVGNYSWYDPGKAIREIDYSITPAATTIKESVIDIRRKMAGVYSLGKTRTLPEAFEMPDNDQGLLLITGVPGWLGNRMVDIIINGDRFGKYRSKRKVRLMVEHRFKNLLELPSNFEIVYADITRKKEVAQAVKGVKSVFHLAGAIYPKHVDVLYKVNEQGTKNLVDACIENNVRRIIFMGTDSICGYGTKTQPVFTGDQPAKPYKNYGRSKYLAEKYILDKTNEGLIDGTSLRGFWFFGPFAPTRQMNFVNMFRWPRQIVFGDGKNFRSISHIDNIIQAFFKAERSANTYGKWYWIGNDEPHITVDTIYATIANVFGVQYKPLYIPKILCRCLEIFDIMLGKMNYINSTIQAAGKFDYHICGTIENAKKDFGYEARVTLQDAARELKDMSE
jgi:dihydroflavonol-4-reductase